MTYFSQVQPSQEVPEPPLEHMVLPTYNAPTLTQGGKQALIKLNGQTYILRITRAGKLILTK